MTATSSGRTFAASPFSTCPPSTTASRVDSLAPHRRGWARPMSAMEQARAHYEAGEFEKARAAAVEGLSSAPDDVELLRLAGRAGVETGAPEAVDQLEKVTELQPDSADAWRDLGDALAAEGRTDKAEKAFQKVLEIEPE